MPTTNRRIAAKIAVPIIDFALLGLTGCADEHLIGPAQRDARTLIENDPGLNRRPGLRDEISRALGADAGAWLTTA